MKKILLVSFMLSTPAAAFDFDAYVGDIFFDAYVGHTLKSFESIMWEYSDETVSNGTYETRSTTDGTASIKLTDILGGSLSVGLTNRNETRTKVLGIGTLSGYEDSYILSFNFTKIQPSWGFWGLATAYGTGKNNITLDWSVDADTRTAIESVTKESGDLFYNSKSFVDRYTTAVGSDKTNGNTNAVDALTATLKDAGKSQQEIASIYNAVGAAYILQGVDGGGTLKETTRLDKRQSGSTKSELFGMAIYAGTQVTFKGINIRPMIKFASQTKKLDSTTLMGKNSDNTKFGLDSGQGIQATVSVKVLRKIGNGVASLTSGITNTRGTDIMYAIEGGSAISVSDNPMELMGVSHRIGYSLPLEEDFLTDISYSYYKNGDDVATAIYVGFIYEF